MIMSIIFIVVLSILLLINAIITIRIFCALIDTDLYILLKGGEFIENVFKEN